LGIHLGTGVEQKLDGFFIAESGGAMQRCFAFAPAIAHEAAGRLVRLGGTIRIGTASE
jgi:hypothetical protein